MEVIQGNLHKLLLRAMIFKSFAQQSIIRVKIDDNELWLMASSYKLYNPSNHSHSNEILKCKDITKLVFSSEEYDQQKFLTTLDNIPPIQFTFSNNFDWFMV